MSVYNDAKRLERAVASILSQSLHNLELVVVDDGSNDGSGELLERLSATDPRLRLVRQENTGLTQALVRACGAARAELIARQDSDDWSHPRRLEQQVALILGDDRIGFVSCATGYVGPADEPLVVVRRTGDPAQATRGLLQEREGPPAHGSVMFRKSLYEHVGGYREEFYYSQDSDLWLRMAALALIGYVHDVRYFHRKDIGSTSGARRVEQSQFAEIAHSCRYAREQGIDEGPLLARARELSRRIRESTGSNSAARCDGALAVSYLLGSQLARNGDRRARNYLWPVVRQQPWHYRAWIRLIQSCASSGRRLPDGFEGA